MKIISIILIAIMFSGCSLLSREFEIIEVESEVEGEKFVIHFYTQENLTELSKSRLVQFRCEVNSGGTNDLIYGEIYMDDPPFQFTRPEDEKYASKYGRMKAGIAHYIDGYKYIGIMYKSMDEIKQYSSLACFVIGVAKAPVTFPRSNKLEIKINENILTSD